MNHHSLATRLVYHRKIKGFSQEKLSHETNVTVRTIQRIESAEVANPHLNTIKLLAIALEIEVDQLLPLTNPKEETIKKKWLLLLHATPLLGLFIPPCNVLIPLFLWIHKKDDNPIYNEHGIKVINFQITALLLAILAFVSLVTLEKWGFFIFILTVPICISIVIFNVVYVVRKDKCYYPFAIPFLRTKSSIASKASALLLLLVTYSCTTHTPQTIERIDGSIVLKDSLTKKIKQLAAAAKVQGMAVALFDNNQPVYQSITGYKDFSKKLILTDSTSMYGASLSKAVFSILVMKLVEEHSIDLDTPLESYLPKKIYEYAPQTRWHDNYSDLKQDSLYQKITARMCLAHTTGFANWRFMEKDRKLKVNGIPGTKYSYSGEGFVYLQVVLEKITGKGLEELAQEIIFKPLQMKNSSYQWQPRFQNDFAYGHRKNGETYEKDIDNEPRGGSTLETTASDYIKFLKAILNQEILSKASYNEIFSPQIRIHSLKNFGPDAKLTTDKYNSINLSYGLGWVYLMTPYGKAVSKAGHGDGFQHYSILFPESGKGILIMTNSDNGESIFKELLAYTMADLYTPWEWSNYLPYN